MSRLSVYDEDDDMSLGLGAGEQRGRPSISFNESLFIEEFDDAFHIGFGTVIQMSDEMQSFLKRCIQCETEELHQFLELAISIVDMESFKQFFQQPAQDIVGKLGFPYCAADRTSKLVFRLMVLERMIVENQLPVYRGQPDFRNNPAWNAKWSIYIRDHRTPIRKLFIEGLRAHAPLRPMTSTAPTVSHPHVTVRTPARSSAPRPPMTVQTSAPRFSPSRMPMVTPRDDASSNEDDSSASSGIYEDSPSRRSTRTVDTPPSERKYSRSSFRHEDAHSFMNATHARTGLVPPRVSAKPRYISVPDTLIFNGRWDAFPELRRRLEAAIHEANMSHLVDAHVQEEFLASGGDYDIITNDLNFGPMVTPTQFRMDVNSFYGTLAKVFPKTGRSTVEEHARTRNSIAVYSKLVERYQVGGNRELMEENWTNEVYGKVYDRTYPGGMGGFATDMDSTFRDLHRHFPNESAYLTPRKCVRLTVSRLRASNDAPEWLLDKCHKVRTMEKLIDKLTSYDQQSQTGMLRTGQRRPQDRRRLLHKARATEDDDDVEAPPLNDTFLEAVADHNRLVANVERYAQRNQRNFSPREYRIPNEIFKFLTEQGREDFFNARSKALQERADQLGISKGKEPPKPMAKEATGGLPRQYGPRHGHLAAQDSAPSDHEHDTDPSEASADVDELADHLTAFGNLGRTLPRAGYMLRTVRGDDCPTVRAHTEYYSTVGCDRGTTSDTPETVNISDSGADTSILNGSYLVVSRSTRVANLVGFDARLGMKKGLPIVNAVTKTKNANGEPILLGVREGVMNEGAPHTLLSEHQIRHSGLICDSVCKTHLLTHDGQRGTQRLYYDPLDYSSSVPFRFNNALMTFQSTRPTEDDIATLKIYWITADGRWAPQDYNDSHPHAVHEALALGTSKPPVKIVEVPQDVNESVATSPTVAPPVEIDNLVELPEPQSAKLILKTWYDEGVPPDTDAHALLTGLAGSATALPPPDDVDDALFYDCVEAPLTNVPCQSQDVFFDPYDYTIPFQGRAFNLTVDFSHWTPDPDDTEDSILVHSAIDSVDVDLFLVKLDDSEIYGRNAPFDVVNFVHQAKVHALRAQHHEMSQRDINWLSKWFNRPLPVIKETLKKTTRLRKAVMTYPLRNHYRSRFRWLSDSIFRLQEIVSTDPIFSSTPAFDGSTAAQVFYGLKSHMINMYGMRSKGEFLATYKKFVRDEGAPSALKRDNSWEQRNQEVMRFNLELHTGNMFSEPGYQHQNDVERAAIRFLKENIVTLMDRSGADLRAWLLCGYYLCDVYNCTADVTLANNMTPKEARHSQVADISHLVDFRFWEPVYYIDSEAKWPETKELKGYWAGIAHNIGDSLTYWIVPEVDGDLRPTPIARSVVRSATNRARENLRKPFNDGMNDPEIDHKLKSLFGDQPLVASKHKKSEPRRRPTEKVHAPRKHKSKRNNPAPPIRMDEGAALRSDVQRVPNDRGAISENDSEMREYEQLDFASSVPPSLRNDASPPLAVSTIADTPAADGPWPRPDNPPAIPIDTHSPAVRRSNRLRDRPRSNWRKVATSLLGFTSQVLLSTSSVLALDPGVSWIVGTSVLPMEPAYVAPTGLSRTDLDRHRALVTMDILNRDEEDQAAWDVMEVLGHRIATTPRRSADNVLLRSYHLRVKSKFRDGHVAWIQGEALRNDDPFPLVQYAHRNGLQKMKWFQWTQAYADDVDELNRMRQVFAAKAANAPKYKFGVQVPSSPKHALFLDKVNGDNYWETSMKKEFESLNEYNTFRVLEESDVLPPGYKRIPYHIIFDVKFDLRRKARLVANGSWTDPPKEDVYSGVVGIDTIRLGFALGSMTGLKCCAADVGTAFLNGRTTEKVFVIAGPEFGKDAGKRMVIEKGLYGLRSSSARFHEHLSTKLRALGFRPSLTDADFWFRKKDDHYEYLATYVDDILHWSKDPMNVIEELKKHYTLKGVGVPEYYLGGDVVDLQDTSYTERGITTALSAKTYIKNVTEKLQQNCGGETFRSANTPLPPGCHPELDESPLLDDKGASQYRALIGSANWCVTLGRFDVAYATNTLARFNMAPREGHLVLAKRIFGYLSNPRYIDGKLMIDPNYHTLREGLCVKASSEFNWQEFYPDAEEDMPVAGTVPFPIGKPVRVTIYVDADHAHCQVSSRSVTGILVFVNNTLVRCISKRQRTVETSTYGSELVAARIAVEMAMEYRFALRSIGVVIDGPVAMYGDNNAVVLNTTLPSSQLKKKHQAVCYHRVREAVAAKIVDFKHIPSWANYADVLTKPVGTAIFHSLLKPILFRSAWKDKAANWIANNLEAPGSSKEGRTAITFEK